MLGELSKEEMRELIENSIVGRIGCSDGERTYVVPISYLYNGDHIVCHSMDGKKIEMMRKNPNVCFEVDEIRDFTHWRCVIAQGRYEELINEREIDKVREHFSQVMLERKASLTSVPPAAGQDSHKQKPANAESVFYRIWFTEVSGRYEHGLVY